MKIIIATGGTGGHIFPAAMVAEELKKDGHDVILIGVFKAYKSYLISRNLKFIEHEAAGVIGKGIGRFLSSLVLMAKATKRCLELIKTERPDAVAGFGGYGAFPVVFAAAISKVPTVIHEQNVVPGRANRVLGLFARKVAVSFKNTSRHWKNVKLVLTGCPCHVRIIDKAKTEIYDTFGLNPDKKTILILGGSQGSKRINDVFLQTIRMLDYADQLQVIHIAGHIDFETVQKAYENSRVPGKVFAFIENIHEAMCLADVVIARAGALTVTELAGYGKSAVLVPLPLAGGHQLLNARVLQEHGQARIIDDQHFTPLYLSQAVKELLEAGTDASDNSENEDPVYVPDAAAKIAALIISAVK